ncbi:hypothetical protein Tco_0268947 [Tanacetum coccineum]
MLNPKLDTGIDSVFNLNTEATSLVDVPVTTIVEPPLVFAKTLPPPPTPLITHILKTLEIDFSEFKQMNQFAEAVSSIPGIVDAYLANKMHEAVKIVVQLQSDRLRDEAQAENKDFLNKLDDNIKKIIKDQVKQQVKAQVSKILPRIENAVNKQLEAEVMTHSSTESKTSLAIAANLSELELKKILIEKMESNKSIHRSNEQKNLYKALVEAYESDKLIFDTYGGTVSFKRRRDDEDKDEEPSAGSNWGSKRRRARKEPDSTSAPKEKTSKITGKSTNGSKSQHKSAAKHPTPDRDWNKTLPAVHGPVQSWLSNLAREEGPHESFNELMDTPLDFLAFMMNRLKIDTLTHELLAGLTFKLMKGTCKSLVELEYFFEGVYKATTDQLDWHNPEGQQYPHDLRKPLPLIPNSRGRQVIPFDHFINNDLAYLSGGVSSRTYATSVTKTKAADYGHIKWIEDLGHKHQQFYGFAANRESARDVYSKRRIIAVIKLQIVKWHGYKHLDWITIRRDDDKLYTFKEGDFKRFRLQDIKDMLILLVQGKLTNLNVEDRLAFSVSLRMFTRSIIIQRRVEDLQLGVESYQKKLYITKPDTYKSNLKRRDAYTTYSNPKGFIYQNKDKKNKLMLIDELHKFSDGTLDDVRTALNDRCYILDVLTYESDDEQISWKLSEEEDNDEENVSEHEDDNDDERTKSENDGDDFVHPKFSTHNDEAMQDEEVNEEDSFDPRVQTPSHVESTDDDEIHDANKDTHVILTAPINPEGQQQSSSVSSGFVSNMLNPRPDTGIDSIFNLNTEATSLVDVPVTTIAEPPLVFATTLPPPPTPLITHMQQTPVPTPTIVPSSSLQDLPNFGSLFGFDHRLKTLETDFSEFKQTNQFAEAVSSIPGIVDAYLANKMNEAVKTVVQLKSDKLRDEAQAKNEAFLNSLDENIKKIIKDQVKQQVKAQVSKILPRIEKSVNEQLEAEVMTRSSTESKTSHAVAANLSELELKKILIDKMESNNSSDTYVILVSFKKKKDDEDEEPSAGSNRGSKRRRARNEPESTSAPKEKTSKTIGKLTDGSKSQHKSAGKSSHTEEPMHTDKDLEEPAHQEFGIRATKEQSNEDTTQHPDWFQKPAKISSPDHDWNKTLLAVHGPVQPCLVELEYFFEEVYKATTDRLDWHNPEGQQYPHDLRKPLPLIPNSRGRQVIPFDHFINNDLAYLSGGVSSRTYATSVTTTKAADYGHIKWIEDLVPNTIWSKVPEGDFKRLRRQDIEDMLILLIQGKLTNLNVEDRLAFGVSLRMLHHELHKFSDGTLDDVRTALNDRLKGIRMEYLPKTIWRQSDRERAKSII